MSKMRTNLVAVAIAVAFPLAATAQDRVVPGPQDSTGVAPSVGTPSTDTDRSMSNRGPAGSTGSDAERHGGTVPFDQTQSRRAPDSSAVIPQDPNVQSGTAGALPSERSAKE